MYIRFLSFRSHILFMGIFCFLFSSSAVPSSSFYVISGTPNVETSFQTSVHMSSMNHVLCSRAVAAVAAVTNTSMCNERRCYTFTDMPTIRNMTVCVQLLMLICSESITMCSYWTGQNWPAEIILLMPYPMQNRYKPFTFKLHIKGNGLLISFAHSG